MTYEKTCSLSHPRCDHGRLSAADGGLCLDQRQNSGRCDQLGKSLEGQPVGSGECVALIKAYYSYLGQTSPGGNGADYSWNQLPAGWTRLQNAQPQKGDILVYGGNGENPYGHVAIYESDYSTWHQNFASQRKVVHVTNIR